MPYEKLPSGVTVISGKVAEERPVNGLYNEKAAYQFAEEENRTENRYVSAQTKPVRNSCPKSPFMISLSRTCFMTKPRRMQLKRRCWER